MSHVVRSAVPFCVKFHEACKDRNFTCTAKRLGISQPAISAAIKNIETLMKANVFDRSTRPLRITSEGAVVYQRSKDVFQKLDLLEQAIQSVACGKNPDLRLGCTHTFFDIASSYLLPRIMDRVGNLSATCYTSQEITDELSEGNLDIAVSTNPCVSIEGIVSQTLLREEFLIIVPKKITEEYSVNSYQELHKILDRLPFIRYSKHIYDHVMIERLFRSLNISNERRIEVNHNKTVQNMVAQGAGWTIDAPLCLWCYKELKDKIKLFKHPRACASRSFYVLHQSGKYAQQAETIYQETQEIFRHQILNDIRENMPELLQYVTLVNDDTDLEK